jgi:hypothetical protein
MLGRGRRWLLLLAVLLGFHCLLVSVAGGWDMRSVLAVRSRQLVISCLLLGVKKCESVPSLTFLLTLLILTKLTYFR